jgi:hypothetical protein
MPTCNTARKVYSSEYTGILTAFFKPRHVYHCYINVMSSPVEKNTHSNNDRRSLYKCCNEVGGSTGLVAKTGEVDGGAKPLEQQSLGARPK